MDFEQLLAQLMNPGEEGPGESIYDDLSASYTNATSTRDAKIGDQDSLIAQLTAELTATKLLNYELMIAQPVSGGESEVPGEDESESENTDSADDDFFDDDKEGK